MNTKLPSKFKGRAILSFLLITAILITGAFAFLTATDSKQNVFTVGNVKAELWENFDTDVNGTLEENETYDASDANKKIHADKAIFPGQTIPKQPYVVNTGKNAAWVYLAVGIPTTEMSNLWQDAETGEVGIAGQETSIKVLSFAIQDGYGGKSLAQGDDYADIWEEYFTDKRAVSAFGQEIPSLTNVQYFTLLDKNQNDTPGYNEDTWERLSTKAYKTSTHNYYIYAYKTMLEPKAENATEYPQTTHLFDYVRLTDAIGEGQPLVVNYYALVNSNTYSAEDNLQGPIEIPENYTLVHTDVVYQNDKLVLYSDDVIASVPGYTRKWYNSETGKEAATGELITQSMNLLAAYDNLIDDTPQVIIPKSINDFTKYYTTDYLTYQIQQDENGEWYATLIGASDLGSFPGYAEKGGLQIIVPNTVHVFKDNDGTYGLDNSTLMFSDLNDSLIGKDIPVRKVNLAKWSTKNGRITNDIGSNFGKIAKRVVLPDSINEVNMCGDVYSSQSTWEFILEEINIPPACTVIPERAFSNIRNLKRVTLPNTVTKIDSYAFSDTGLTTFTVPKSITRLGKRVFADCNDLSEVNIKDLLSYCNIEAEYVEAGYNNTGCYPFTFDSSQHIKLYVNDELVTGTLEFPEGVTKIAKDTFNSVDYSYFDTISLPKSLETIESAGLGATNISYNSTLDDWTQIKGLINLGKSKLYVDNQLVTNVKLTDNVSKIEDYAFDNLDDVITAELPDTITSIGNNAFSASGLTTINIPASISSIGDRAFQKSKLAEIDLPLSDFSIGYLAFSETLITELNLPASAKVEVAAFMSCPELTSVVLEEGVTEIATYCFSNCQKLASVTFPENSLKSIGDMAFSSYYTPYTVGSHGSSLYANKLTSVRIPDSVTTIGNNVFTDCRELQTLIISDSVTELGQNFVSGYTYKLTNLVIGNGITSIPTTQFGYFTNCSYISLGSNIQTIEIENPSTGRRTTLDRIGAVIAAEVDEANAYYYDVNGIVFTRDNSKIVYIPPNNHSGNYYNVAMDWPSGSTSITSEDVYKKINTTVLNIPATVTEIEDSVFSQFPNLKAINVDANNPNYYSVDGILYTKDMSKVICIPPKKDMATVILPEGLITLPANTIMNNSSIRELSIPSTLVNFGAGNLEGCPNLVRITVADGNPKYDSRNNCNAVIETATNTLIKGCKGTGAPATELVVDSTGKITKNNVQGNIIIPDTVEHISDHAFYALTSIKTVSIPDSVQTIGKEAFSFHKSAWNTPSYYNLTKVTFGTGLKFIDEDAFAYHTKINTVIIPNQEAWLGMRIANSTSLPAIGNGRYQFLDVEDNVFVVPDGVETFDTNLFGDTQPSKIYLPESVTNIRGSHTVNTDFYITDLAKFIQIEQKGYYKYADEYPEEETDGYVAINSLYCNGVLVTNMVIPDGVTHIGTICKGMKNLQSVEMPDSVTSISANAFAVCQNLQTVTYSKNLTEIPEDTFYYTGLKTITNIDGVTKLGEGCFALSKLESIVLPEGLTEIPAETFKGCTELSSISFPSTLKLIHSYAFKDTRTSSYDIKTRQFDVYISDLDSWCKIRTEYQDYTHEVLKLSKSVYLNNTLLTDVVINNTTDYRLKCLANTQTIESVTIAEGVNYIPSKMFENSENLKTIYLPHSLTWISDSAFKACPQLTDVYYDGTVEDWRNVHVSNGFSSDNSIMIHCTDRDFLYE